MSDVLNLLRYPEFMHWILSMGRLPTPKRTHRYIHATLGTTLEVSWTSWWSVTGHVGFWRLQESAVDHKEQIPKVISFKTFT